MRAAAGTADERAPGRSRPLHALRPDRGRHAGGSCAALADRLVDLQARYREELQRPRATATTLALVDALFVNPIVTVRRAQEILGVSNPTARAAVAVLHANGVLQEVTSRRWGKVFRANEIYEVTSDLE